MFGIVPCSSGAHLCMFQIPKKQHQEIKQHNQPTVTQTHAIDASATSNTEPFVMSRADIIKYYAKLNPDHG